MPQNATRGTKKATLGDALIALELATTDTLGVTSADQLVGRPRFAEAVGRAYEIRNKVHVAPEWSDLDLAGGFVWVMTVYLFATAEHYQRLRACLDSAVLQDHLCRVADRFKVRESRGVHLDASEDIPNDHLLDPFAVEVLYDADQPVKDEGTDDSADDARSPPVRRGRVLDLIDQIPRMVLLGDPGAGKSTTLNYCAQSIASALIRDPGRPYPVPVYLELRLCSSERSLSRSPGMRRMFHAPHLPH